MISRYLYSLYIATFCFFIIVVSASTASLWFLRGVIGNSQGVVEAGYSQGVAMNKLFGQFGVINMDSYLRFSLSIFSRVVYVQDRSLEYVVGIPTIKEQLSSSAHLHEAGWNVTRLGWILVARRPINGSIDVSNGERKIDVVNGLFAEASAIFLRALPANPTFFVRAIPGFSSIENGFSLYGNINAGGVYVSAEYDSGQFLHRNKQDFLKKSNQINGLFVSIQSEILRFLSGDILSTIDSSIANRFHFIKTSPSIVSSLEKGVTVRFYEYADETGIGMVGGASLADSVVRYMQFEQGTRHPVKKKFLLPDGTVGYEYIPSSPKIVFENIEKTDCAKSVEYDEHLFMCKDSSGNVVIATSLEIAQRVIIDLKTGSGTIWGSVQGDELKKILPENIFRQLLFIGDNKGLQIQGIY